MQGEGVKLNYTTGTVTQRNYIQKREGVIAEFTIFTAPCSSKSTATATGGCVN